MTKHGAVLSTADVSGAVGQISATPGAIVSLDVTTGNHAKWTAGEAETINLTGAQFSSQELTLIITNDGVLPRVITFGTGFAASGVITGTVSKTAIIRFVSNGTSFYELARTLALG